MRGVALATVLAIALSFLAVGCGGSSGEGGTPGQISPEMEKKTQEMLNNKSKDYNERFKAKGGSGG